MAKLFAIGDHVRMRFNSGHPYEHWEEGIVIGFDEGDDPYYCYVVVDNSACVRRLQHYAVSDDRIILGHCSKEELLTHSNREVRALVAICR